MRFIIRYINILYGLWVGIRTVSKRSERRAFIDTPVGTHPSVLLNASRHKKYEHIWFVGGDLNGFRDIKLFL